MKKYNSKLKIFTGKYVLKNKKSLNLKSKYLAFCGIGTPENFFYLLQENKINIKKKIIFPDHYNYTSSDIERIISIANKNNFKIITTEKDFMKVKRFNKYDIKFTNVDLKIDKSSFFKKFLFNNI